MLLLPIKNHVCCSIGTGLKQSFNASQLCTGATAVRVGVKAYGTVNAEQQQVALVQGASRGLGLEYVRQLLSRPGQKVVATCRDPANSSDLQQLFDQHKEHLSVVKLDVTEESSIQAAAEEVASEHDHLNLLVNAAGILHIPGVLSPETALSRLDSSSLQKVFAVNAFGPILVSKAFLPLLSKNAKDRGKPSVIANMSARVGSIGDNNIGGWYSYRGSKSALNQLTKTMSLECARRKLNVACILLHPGTVDTDLSLPFQKNVRPDKLFTKERAVNQLLDIIDDTSMSSNGRFYAWDKKEIIW